MTGKDFIHKFKYILLTGFYFLFYLVALWPIRLGIGQYWDWSLPYFRDQLPNVFTKAADSWIVLNFGSAMEYKSDILIRWITELLFYTQLEVETLIYICIAICFSIGSLLMYIFFLKSNIVELRSFISGKFLTPKKQPQNHLLAIICSLAVFINPAIFYKLVAGHYLYFISLVIFIGLILYLKVYHRRTFISYLGLGFILGVISPQIQFLVFGYFYLISFL
jgi:hypothetical protein